MKVSPIEGEKFRFHVQSDSRPDIEHLVDFEAYWFIGKCGCEYFQFRLEPKLAALSRSKVPHPASEEADDYRCGHLRNAWNEVSRTVMVSIMKDNARKNGGKINRKADGW